MVEVYVDGSYQKNISPNHVGCGVVVLYNGEVVHKISKLMDACEYASHHNVTGEVLATMIGIDWVYKSIPNVKQMTIYYDYLGIWGWANNWKANNKLSVTYKRFVRCYQQVVDIKFKKVKSHSGNRFNELADCLASKCFNDLLK